MWKKSLDAIGVRMEVQKDKFPELLKLEKQCKLMMRTASWIADYPDGDNFMQLLYGKNIAQSNNACASIPEYDRLYEQSLRDARLAGARQALPRDGQDHRGVRAVAARHRALPQHAGRSRRCSGFKKHPILHSEWQYIDVAGKTGNVPAHGSHGTPSRTSDGRTSPGSCRRDGARPAEAVSASIDRRKIVGGAQRRPKLFRASVGGGGQRSEQKHEQQRRNDNNGGPPGSPARTSTAAPQPGSTRTGRGALRSMARRGGSRAAHRAHVQPGRAQSALALRKGAPS